MRSIISARQFMELLFGKLPEFFKDEDELRKLWSSPDTRKKLLKGLAEKVSLERDVGPTLGSLDPPQDIDTCHNATPRKSGHYYGH